MLLYMAKEPEGTSRQIACSRGMTDTSVDSFRASIITFKESISAYFRAIKGYIISEV